MAAAAAWRCSSDLKSHGASRIKMLLAAFNSRTKKVERVFGSMTLSALVPLPIVLCDQSYLAASSLADPLHGDTCIF